VRREPAGRYLTNLETILPAAANTQHTHLAQPTRPTVPGFFNRNTIHTERFVVEKKTAL
jgi:hypothetical protein